MNCCDTCGSEILLNGVEENDFSSMCEYCRNYVDEFDEDYEPEERDPDLIWDEGM